MKKRIASVVMALILCPGLLPTVALAADAVDQKGETKTLSQVINEQDWHIVIGPRYYNNTGGEEGGIGAGKDGIWENCDYYVGTQSEVLVDTSIATFDPSNGEPVVKSVDAPQDPTYKDYTFEGWYDQPNGWGSRADSFTLGNTYYAHYTKDGKTVYTRTLDFTNSAAFTPPDSGDGYTLERNKQVTITENGKPTDYETDCLTLNNILVDTVDPYGIKVPGDIYPGFCIDLPAGTESTITGGRVIVTSEDVPRVAGLQGGKYLLLTGSGTLNVTGNDIISDDNGGVYSTISYGISMSKTLDAQLIVDGPTVNASGGKGLHSTKWWMTSSVGIQPYIFMFNGKLTARGNEVASRGSNGTSNGITIYDGEFYAYGNDSGIGDGSGSDITTYGGKIYATGKTRATATCIYDKSMSFTGLAILKGSLEYNAPSDTLTPAYYAQGDGQDGPWMDESKTDDQRTKTLLIYHEPELIVTGKSSFAYGADATGETYTVNAVSWKTEVGDTVAVENAKIFFGAEGEELTEITDSVTFTDNFEESEKGTATAAFTGLDLTGKNVGKYTLKITATDPGDDTKAGVVEGTLAITVTLAEIDAPTGNNNTFTYDGKEKTFTPDGYDADTAAYMLSGNTETDAGSYTATLLLKDKANTVWKDTKKAEDRTLPYTITKAAAPVLDKISVSQKYTVNTQQSKDIGRAGMPADAGTLTYAKGTEAAIAHVSSWSVNNTTGEVTYTLSGAAGATVTLPVVITSTNYEDATVDVVITLTDKDTPTATANDITVTYTGSAVAITGTASVEGTWSFKNAAPVNVADSSDNVTVVFTPADTDTYETVDDIIKVTINKATPTGTPTYTAITTGGKTLADAALSVGSITPDGTIKWVDDTGAELPSTTVVAANTAYKWLFTPTDTANYNTLTGSITPYVVSYSGGGSSSSTTTTTEKNPDGSTTTTVTDKTTGTVTETTKNTDGSTTTVETKKDGTVTETVKSADGTTGTVVTDSSGEVTEVKASVSSAAVTEAAKTGDAVTLPVEVPAAKTTEAAPAVEVTVPKSAGSVKVEIPVEQVTPGTVAVIVHADGTEEIVSTSIPTETGVVLPLDGSATVKIVDNAKALVDIHPVSHWAEDAVDFVVARGMFAGTSETTFSPNSPMTRAMLMTVLARFDGEDTSGGSVWYEKGMEWAKANGVSDGSNPDAPITRGQLATMLWRYAGSPTSSHSLDGYTDADKISGYALEAMRWANENGIINGYGNGLLGVKDNATRAQVAQMLMNFVKCLNQ